ncbi:MAG: DUF885 domain-containing protein [Candidatus Thermoplasmatota archaeon]|nr:DUF885 domain-containing protein [Candidatus Thermoplasmatota archaeon]
MDINEEFEEFEEEIFETFIERNPTMATHLGIHEHDHRLPEVTREKFVEDIELMEDWLEELKDFDQKELDRENKIAKKLGLHIFELRLFSMKELRQWEQAPNAPNLIGSSLLLLLKREFAPIEERLESIISRIEEVPRVLEEERSRLEDPVRLWIDMAIESAEQLPMLFKLVQMLAKEKGLGEEKLEKVNEATNKADEALEQYIDDLKDLRRDASEDYTIGEEKFEDLLEKRDLGYDSEEIHKIGEELLEEAKDDMKRYAEKIDSEGDVQKAVEKVESKTPENFGDALGWYEEGLEDAKDFIEENDLATIPEGEEIEVMETPEYMRNIIPFAAYISPAKFDETKKGIYVVTPPNEESNLSNYSYWDVRNTTVHEGYPGHHLQLAAATTNDDVFRIFSHATETVEGWAHYCEEMMKDHGFDDTPEARLIQSKDIVWRAARIIVDVRLSTGKMSFEEAVDYLVDNVGMDRQDAEKEVKRYTQNPAYQLSYLLGKKMIKELKEDVKEKMGDDFSEKFFHDTILYAGSVPMKYLREIFEKKIEES